MIFEQVATGGCQSYLIGCGETCAAAVIDAEVRQLNRYQALAAQHGVRIRYVIDTHTHADHFSGSKQLAELLDVPVVAHALSPSPYVTMHVDEGDVIKVGNVRLAVLHTPGHTRDSMCLVASDRVFTGEGWDSGADRYRYRDTGFDTRLLLRSDDFWRQSHVRVSVGAEGHELRSDGYAVLSDNSPSLAEGIAQDQFGRGQIGSSQRTTTVGGDVPGSRFNSLRTSRYPCRVPTTV